MEVIEEIHQNEMTDVKDIERFIRAGKAKFTVVSKRTGQRFTFRARTLRDKDITFVSVLNGPDNHSDYMYIGYFKTDAVRLCAGKKGKPGATSFKAFDWILSNVSRANDIGDQMTFLHTGSCGRCGRELTVPESIRTGLGPVCSNLA